ncbi:amidohydrolase [Pseudonocardia sulfidoxydans NBRC 16205]|uniref:Amidohydrolase n=1 Tax=Pseudonocardia sulfidoxydans NBRC 16205 TaxID=1223511 RepID=A0A511DKD9_9PSEU|nr:amidohydrolase family protein [Pseudonocardia sulfidoxydans]GEL23508.1 amidohydrolase [Pseudonocardia sulfidoxydans NBRC 16205]
MIVTGGTIRTMDPAAPRAEAVGVRDGVIAAVGTLAAVSAAVGGPVHDIGGDTLLPGFVDPHHHLYLVASDVHTRALDVALRDLGALLDRISALRGTGSGWLRLHGVRPLQLTEGRLPTAAELDAVCPDRPLHVMSISYHESTVNSAGLAALGIGAGTPDPPGGVIERDRRGRPTGVLVEQASFAAESATRRATDDPDGWVRRAVEHSHELARHGVTRIGDMAVPPAGATRYATAAPDLAVVAHRWHVGTAEIGDPAVPALAADGHPRAPLGGFKILADGGERCDLCLDRRQLWRSTASLPAAVARHGRRALALARRGGTPARRADGRWHNGTRVLDADGLRRAVHASVAAGLSPAVHAVGNGAVADLLDATRGVDEVLRVEHAMVCDAALARRIGDAGLQVVAQPSFLHDLGDELTVLPLPDPLRLVPLRTLRAAGVHVALSTDYPAGTMSPLVGIGAAVTRRTRSGQVVHADEALTVEEAVAAWTRDAAAVLRSDAGILRVGAPADLVALGADPWTADPDHIASIEVTGTWSAGGRTFTAPTRAVRPPCT